MKKQTGVLVLIFLAYIVAVTGCNVINAEPEEDQNSEEHVRSYFKINIDEDNSEYSIEKSAAYYFSISEGYYSPVDNRNFNLTIRLSFANDDSIEYQSIEASIVMQKAAIREKEYAKLSSGIYNHEIATPEEFFISLTLRRENSAIHPDYIESGHFEILEIRKEYIKGRFLFNYPQGNEVRKIEGEFLKAFN